MHPLRQSFAIESPLPYEVRSFKGNCDAGATWFYARRIVRRRLGGRHPHDRRSHLSRSPRVATR